MPGRAPAPSAEYLAARERNRSGDKQTRSYRVVGPRSVYGAEPGSVVELELSEGQRNALVEAGHLALAEVETEPEPAWSPDLYSLSYEPTEAQERE